MHAKRSPWLRYLVLLIAIWLVVVAVAGVALFRARSSARDTDEKDFQQRTRVAATFVGSYARRLHDRMAAAAQASLTPTTVPAPDLHIACTVVGFTACGLFDSTGRLLMNAPYLPQFMGQNFASLEQVAGALRTGRPTIAPVNISPALRAPVVAFGLPFSTPSGRRVFTGIFSVESSTLLRDANLSFELAGTDSYVVDRAGNLAATTRGTLPDRITSLESHDPELAAAVRAAAQGTVRSTYYTVATVSGTPWRLVATVRTATLYRSSASVTTVGLWSLAALAVLGLAALLALVRTLHRSEQARGRLEQAEAENRQRQRMAREVNDAIVQGLVAAEVAADLGDLQQSRELLRHSARAAQQWIGELLIASGPVQAGTFVRDEAAASATGAREGPPS